MAFTPYGSRDAPPQPCWWCTHFGGITASGTAALCVRSRALAVRAMPEHGCAYYSREPGADDVPEWCPLQVVMAPLSGAPAGRPPLEWAP